MPSAPRRIPVEEAISGRRFVLRAELPGIDPDEDLRITCAAGELRLDVCREPAETRRMALRVRACAAIPRRHGTPTACSRCPRSSVRSSRAYVRSGSLSSSARPSGPATRDLRP